MQGEGTVRHSCIGEYLLGRADGQRLDDCLAGHTIAPREQQMRQTQAGRQTGIRVPRPPPSHEQPSPGKRPPRPHPPSQHRHGVGLHRAPAVAPTSPCSAMCFLPSPTQRRFGSPPRRHGRAETLTAHRMGAKPYALGWRRGREEGEMGRGSGAKSSTPAGSGQARGCEGSRNRVAAILGAGALPF